MNTGKQNHTMKITVIGGLAVLIILIAGTILTTKGARNDTEEAVRTVSLLYLDELAGRREQVVENNLNSKIEVIRTALNQMTDEDLSEKSRMEAFQTRIRELYKLDKFAFVDEDGLIYTSYGNENNIEAYPFDYRTIDQPQILILNPKSIEKKVIIALPVEKYFQGKRLTVCFMEIDMAEMLSGVSMASGADSATFCNIYTRDGIALTDTVLGGLAVEDNLLEAMEKADYEPSYSYEAFLQDFQEGKTGESSFTYNGIRETLSYVPVEGTDWFLTYLIRESVISDKISSITNGIILRSVLQSALTIAALLIMFGFIISQSRKNAALRLQKETEEAENRVKQEEMQQRLILQEQLLEDEMKRTQQDSMITAMAADYRSVYHVDLDKDEAVCYRSDPDDQEMPAEGTRFSFQEVFRNYAERHIVESYRDEFLKFIDPEHIRDGLRKEKILVYRYLVARGEKEYYEMIRAAGVRHADDASGGIHEIGLGLTVIDAEMREDLARQQALSDALDNAQQANRAKTAFLSNMSHEIRTPMNAIIGLDNIAYNDPETPEKTKEYLKKIGSSAEHLLTLINDILDMSRIESGRLTLRNEEFSFQKLLEAINTMFSSQASDRGIDYQCHISGEVDDYYIGDNMKLRQVLINILGNAMKFTPEGGKVELHVQRKAQYEGQTVLSFTISDTGIGMSEEFLPHIFDAFSQEDSSTTSKYGSSGLGLAITRNIVEMMNGNIQVTSEKGKGSTFAVTVTLGDSVRNEADESIEEIHPEDMTVLVVDDDPIACEHAKLVLEKAGIAADTVSSGKEAVEIVKLRHARRNPYNLILVDWKMPEMDGVETVRQMRAVIGHESAIIILTAYRWDDVFDEAVQAGVDSFIPKPLFATAVMEEFRDALKRKATAAKDSVHKADLKGRKILLAEDVEINAEIMTMVLQAREMEADTAQNGRIAVEKFESHEAGYYDAILMDMRMPEMDGLEATRRIRSMDRSDAKTIPIIALTANAFDEDVQRSLQAGLNAHLSKPVQPESLYETLESLISDDPDDNSRG